MNFKEISALVGNDIILEIKHKYAFNSLLLYVFSSVFLVSYLIGNTVNQVFLNILIWIVLVFNTLNASGKSFIQLSKEKILYYNSLASPQSIIIAKIIYNSLLMALISLLTVISFEFLIGVYKSKLVYYLPVFVLGSVCISSIITFISAVTYYSKNSLALTGVLSFPLLFPALVLLVKLTEFAIIGNNIFIFYGLMSALIILLFVVILLAYILFPYIWKD